MNDMLYNYKVIDNEIVCRYKGITKHIVTPIILNVNKSHYEYKAIWDTGAERSCIFSDVIKPFNLQKVSTFNLRTVNRNEPVNTYFISISLKELGKISDNIEIIGLNRNTDIFDVIIGIDIINMGDFYFGIEDGCSIFKFRIPSRGIKNNIKFKKAW